MSEDSHSNDGSHGPAPEVLSVSGSESTEANPVEQQATATVAQPATPKKRISYRPSHKGTFIGMAVVIAILAANAGIIAFVMRNQATAEETKIKNGVTLSSESLDKLGVSRNPAGNAGTELIVGPKSTFKDNVQMAGNLQVAGQLNLNSKFTASDAALTKLQAGDTQLQALNVNGDGTISTLNLRKDLKVVGTTQLDGALTVNQLTTINNNLNVAGNLSIGGSLSVRNFQVGTLTIAGHIISTGQRPTASAGNGTGSNGTAAISGNDTSGTVSVNTGVGAGNGLLATVTFTTKYGDTPHVVVTPVGRSVPGMYINRTSAGFTISVDGVMPPGGYAFDYIVMQ